MGYSYVHSHLNGMTGCVCALVGSLSLSLSLLVFLVLLYIRAHLYQEFVAIVAAVVYIRTSLFYVLL